MRISYWSSDVCSSDLAHHQHHVQVFEDIVDGLDGGRGIERDARLLAERGDGLDGAMEVRPRLWMNGQYIGAGLGEVLEVAVDGRDRSEEHTSELQSLMRLSYAVFCLKKTNATRLT